MLNIKKIQDKSLNLDVKGQGCWSDCLVHTGYYERRTSTPKCDYIAPEYDWRNNLFS